MNDWDERYRQAHEKGELMFNTTPTSTVVKALDRVKILSRHRPAAVDVGAGEGRHSRELARRGFFVTALEASARAVEDAVSAREVAASDGLGADLDRSIDWICGDVRYWEPEEPVDLVLVAFLHQAEFSLLDVLPRMVKWLKPGGWLVCVGHAVEQLGREVAGPQDSRRLWKLNEVREMVSLLELRLVVCENWERVDSPRSGSPSDGELAVDTVVVAQR